MIDYEAIAKEAGYRVVDSILWPGMYWWQRGDNQGTYQHGEQEAWRVCCIENNLIQDE